MSVQIPFPLPSTGFALNSKMRINLDFLVDQFNQFNTGAATWDTVAIGIPNSETGTLTFWNSSNANYLTFQAGATSPNTTFTLPTSAPSANHKFLTSTTGGVMGWSTLSEATSYVGNQLLYIDSSAVIQELSVGSGNKVLVNSTPPSFFDLLGTSNQVIVTPNVGNYTFSLPQSIATSSNVTFNSLQVDGGSATNPGLRVIFSGAATNTGIWSSSGTELDFTVAGATRLSLDSTGLAVATGEFRAPTIQATTALKLVTASGPRLTMQTASSGGTPYTITWPNAVGASNTVLTTDNSGNLSWSSVSAIGGADNALDNLASVAINTSLLPGSSNSIDLGSSSKKWKDAYIAGTLNGVTGSFTGTVSGAVWQSTSASPASTGSLRLANGDSIGWRKNSGSGDYFLTTDTSDILSWGNTFKSQLYLVADGSNTAPTYSFTSSATDGFYHSATNEISMALNSVQRIAYTTTEIQSRLGSGGQTHMNFYDTVNDQAAYIRTSHGASSSSLIISSNRKAGGNYKTGQAVSNIVLNANVSDGNIQFGTTATNNSAASNRMIIDKNGNITMGGGSSQLSTSATDGFFYLDSCAGTPTGVPTSYAGNVPLVYDTTNDKFYIYNGAWKTVLTSGATKALDNLASTAVNASILPATGNSVDLGSNSLPWLNFYTSLIQIGASGTLGHFSLYPGTASKGNFAIVPVDNAGNTITTLTYASQAAARTYTIPDAGADANFVMTQGTQTVVGQTTFSASAGNPIHGTNTNDSASAGYIGEYVESVVGSTNVGTTSQLFDLTSISLTAGDWDVSGEVEYNQNGGTFSATDFRLGIGTVTGNDATGLTRGSNYLIVQTAIPTTFTLFAMSQCPYRVSLSTTTTLYLKGYCGDYTGTTPKSRCRISARRVR